MFFFRCQHILGSESDNYNSGFSITKLKSKRSFAEEYLAQYDSFETDLVGWILENSQILF